MKEFLIRHILAWIAGLTAEQWDAVLGWVIEAEKAIVGGTFKKAWVVEQLKKAWPKFAQWAVDAIIGLATGYAGKKGWIHLGDGK